MTFDFNLFDLRLEQFYPWRGKSVYMYIKLEDHSEPSSNRPSTEIQPFGRNTQLISINTLSIEEKKI